MPHLRTTHYSPKTKQGFTLVELIIYTGLTVIIVGLFGGILISVVRIQSQQSAVRQVTSEADFVLSTIKRTLRESSWFETHGNWLSVITPSSSGEIIIDINSGAIRKQETSGGPFFPLTSNRVIVDSLTFTTYTSGLSKAVGIELTISNNSTNPQQAFTQTLETTVAPLKRPN